MSRQQSVLRNTVGYMNIDNQATNGEEKSKPEVIKLGLDLHARQVTECRQLDGSTPKPAQQWDPWKLPCLDKAVNGGRLTPTILAMDGFETCFKREFCFTHS